MDLRNNSNSAGIWIAVGLALGLGICLVIILNNLSQNVKLNGIQQSQNTDAGVSYVYDENGRLKAMIPVKLKGLNEIN